MSIKAKLQEITATARKSTKYSEQIETFSSYILTNWILKCAECANNKEDSLKLVAYDGDSSYDGVKITSMVKYGLIDVIKKKTQLDVYIREYIIDRDKRECIEIVGEAQFIGDNTFKHYFIIWLSWS